MYYLSWAKATKPKGISIVGALTGYDPPSSRFDDETLNVYEIGAKTDWLDKRLVLNTSLFYQEFDDKLVSSQKQDPDSGVLYAAPVNASKATVYGLELDVAWQATEALQLTGSYTYLDTEYDDFTSLTKGAGSIADAGNCTIVDDPTLTATSDFCQIDLSGNEMEFAPKHALVGGYSWRQPLVGDTDWLFEGDLIYQDERYQDAVNTVELDSYTTVDFRLGLASKQWDIIAYVDNAFEDDTIKSYEGRPRLRRRARSRDLLSEQGDGSHSRPAVSREHHVHVHGAPHRNPSRHRRPLHDHDKKPAHRRPHHVELGRAVPHRDEAGRAMTASSSKDAQPSPRTST